MKTLEKIQVSYSNVGPTSVTSSVVARKKTIQRRVNKTQFFGNMSNSQQTGVNGDSSTRTYFQGIFPRIRYD